jgi:hypothetical protein
MQAVMDRWSAFLPDFVLGLAFAALATESWTGVPMIGEAGLGAVEQTTPGKSIWTTIMAVEALTLLPQISLMDVASSFKTRPPLWSIPILIALVFVLVPGGLQAAQLILAQPHWLLVPVLWTLFVRGRGMWVLPQAPETDRLRYRALAAGRFNHAIAGLIAAGAFAIWQSRNLAEWSDAHKLAVPMLGFALYYLLCAVEALWVHRASFSEKPRPLLRYQVIEVTAPPGD